MWLVQKYVRTVAHNIGSQAYLKYPEFMPCGTSPAGDRENILQAGRFLPAGAHLHQTCEIHLQPFNRLVSIAPLPFHQRYPVLLSIDMVVVMGYSSNNSGKSLKTYSKEFIHENFNVLLLGVEIGGDQMVGGFSIFLFYYYYLKKFYLLIFFFFFFFLLFSLILFSGHMN